MPFVIIMIALSAAYITIRIDQSATGRMLLELLPGHDQITVEGARQMVSAVAGSTITVASLVFSLTFVALTLMSQQFGPRIVLVFMNDNLTKFVIGAFAGTFLYSLIVLGAVGLGQGEAAISAAQGLERYGIGPADLFIPKLSVYLTGLLGILSFVLIVFFVHHMAMSIQADAIVARLGNELDRAIENALVRKDGEETTNDQDEENDFADDLDTLEKDGHEINAPTSGYVQTIAFDRLVDVAEEHDARIQLICRPGHFIVEGRPIARATNSGSNQSELDEAICESVELGERRTQAQSAEYEVSALVEVALRALSPGINDPFTAMACIDHLTDALTILLREQVKPIVLNDTDGKPRVYRHPQAFEHFLDSSFHPIRQSAQNNTQMLIHLAQALDILSSIAKTENHRSALRVHLSALEQDCSRETENTRDKEYVLSLLEKVKARLSNA